jgi:thymidylate kinase
MLLIILRGPAGSGKSTVSKRLKNKFKIQKSIDSYLLNLDEVREIVFESYMKEALEYEYVIGEIYYGNNHTTKPETWINRFKEKDYDIFSFILKASKETCHERCKNDKNNDRSPTNRIQSQNHYDHGRFYKNKDFSEFAENAIIHEEIIDTEGKHEQVVDTILSKIIS